MLERDRQLVEDIEGQMTLYRDDLDRNFEARLSELSTLLYEMDRRGNVFFEETIRIGRVTDLIKQEYIKSEFERIVVADTPTQIENRVGELVDWMVEQDLRQWSAVSDHLSQRRQEMDGRIVGQAGPKDSTLAYDRQRLVDSIGKTARKTVNTYDKQAEAGRIANTAREAVTGIAAGGLGVGLGVALLVATTTAWIDVTGVITGLSAAILGVFIFPSRRRKAKQELGQRLEELRHELLTNLREQFDRESRRGQQRIEDTVSPFSRFVRSERSKMESRRQQLIDLEGELDGLGQQASAL